MSRARTWNIRMKPPFDQEDYAFYPCRKNLLDFGGEPGGFLLLIIKRHNEVPTMDRPKPLPGYLGGNCEFGTGVARLAVGALLVNPMTAQLMSTPEAPYGAPPGPVSRSGRVAARLKTTFSSICRVLSPSLTALALHW